MRLKFFKNLILGTAAITGIGATGALGAVTEADVFDWWDSGIISPGEAEEILAKLDEGDESEACILAETYAQESCEESSDTGTENATKTAKTAKRPSAKEVHGHFLYKARFDSAGHLKSHREELQLEFYRYTLKLGSQELLTYKNGASEAHFGEISTKELHSQIPLDTLWGTALLYPIGNLFVGGMLDTSTAANVRLGYRIDKAAFVEGIYWRQQNDDAHGARDIQSGELQTKFNFGETAVWWQQGHDAPLVKIRLKGKSGANKSGASKGNANKSGANQPKIQWTSTAYVHGDSIPRFARLSSTIAKSRIWGSQAITGTAQELANTKITANARFLNPLHSDSISMRLKLAVQSGPSFLRTSAAATCLEASENCRKDDLLAGIESSFVQNLTLQAKAKARYQRDDGLGTPQMEIGAKICDSQKNFAKVTAVWPKGATMEKFQLRNETHLRNEFLDISLSTTFKNGDDGGLHPSHAAITAKIMF